MLYIKFITMRYVLLLGGVATAFAAAALDLDEIGARLAAVPCYRADARCEILLPNADVPVVYTLALMSSAAPGDTLSVCDYLIDWSVTTPAGTHTTGFTSYAAGNHFRYRDGRLQEYHIDGDAVPFAPRGRAAEGVQARAQFVDFLPQRLGLAFEAMASDSTHHYTVEERGGRVTVRGVERVRGYDRREYTYELDASTLLPLEVEYVTSPGMPAEQTLTMTYGQAVPDGCVQPTEAALAEKYADAFGKYRSDTYSIEHLPGRRMPTFSAPTPTGERYTYDTGEPMGAPTVIAILDSRVDGTADVVKELREAALLSSVACKLILAFIDTDIDSIESVAPGLEPEEAILMGARTLARDSGASVTPSIIFCRPDGTVADVMIGRNNQLCSSVIQKIAILK